MNETIKRRIKESRIRQYEIAFFDSLYTAGCVLRYLKGAPMLAEDVREAHQAMQEFDRKRS